MTDTAKLIARVRELAGFPLDADSDFVGPCAHGRDPYWRCDLCCEDPVPAETRSLAVQLADALEAAEAENKRLASICTRANPYLHRIGAVSGSVADRAQTASEIHEQTQKQLTASRERERRLREALRPFGELGDLHGIVDQNDSRRLDARAALAAADGETGGGT